MSIAARRDRVASHRGGSALARRPDRLARCCVRAAYRIVNAIHAPTATMNIARRSRPPENGGSCASFSAMPA